jgi:transcriptional regulator with XRE-family HTH domain
MRHDVRISRNASISECAALIGAGRPRYRDIESGESYATAAELELLMEFLQIPQDATGRLGAGGVGKIFKLPISIAPSLLSPARHRRRRRARTMSSGARVRYSSA